MADLHPDRGTGVLDADDIQFTPGSSYPIPATSGTKTTGGALTGAGNEFYGMAKTNPAANNWINPVGYPGWTSYPLLGELTTASHPGQWPGRMDAH